MDLGIKGRWAIVCAGSKGLGRACAEALAAEGVNLVLNARNEAALAQTAKDLAARSGVEVVPVAADIATDSGRALVLGAAPVVDILVNNAGGPAPGRLATWSDADWDKALATNLRAPVAMIGSVIEGMKTRGFGRIVNITSSVLRHPIDIQGLSIAARAGLHGMVATLVRDAVRHNVTINNVLPGAFATDRLMANFAFRAKEQGVAAAEVVEARRKELPAQRFGDPAELGRLCAYLCSVHAGYMSGQSLLLDGAAHPQLL